MRLHTAMLLIKLGRIVCPEQIPAFAAAVFLNTDEDKMQEWGARDWMTPQEIVNLDIAMHGDDGVIGNALVAELLGALDQT
jgi:hypothetical protein